MTFGRLAGHDKRGADGTSWTAFTTLRGITAKHRGEGEFDDADGKDLNDTRWSGSSIRPAASRSIGHRAAHIDAWSE